jgi:undecaprenyl diphosphate synthase
MRMQGGGMNGHINNPPESIAVPNHVAIIMDGNGRWASARGLPRFEGHRRGVESVRKTVKASIELGIDYLTIFSFSAENWSRPAAEIMELMGLLKRFIRNDLASLHKQNVRVRIIGERENLSNDLIVLLQEAETVTALNTGLNLIVAFNYGGRQEIVRAAQAMAKAIESQQLASANITTDVFASFLDTGGIPEPDLLIRTSGEQRISNFLLWQCAYSEFVFLPVLWPDFDKSHLEQAIIEFNKRERRFGGVLVEKMVQAGRVSA